jgi:hypothetical protein
MRGSNDQEGGEGFAFRLSVFGSEPWHAKRSFSSLAKRVSSAAAHCVDLGKMSRRPSNMFPGD